MSKKTIQETIEERKLREDVLKKESKKMVKKFNKPKFQLKTKTLKEVKEDYESKRIKIDDVKVQRNFTANDSFGTNLIVTAICFGLPIGLILLVKKELIDGQQRIKSLLNFIFNKYALTGLKGKYAFLNGFTFNELPSELQECILNIPIIFVESESKQIAVDELFTLINKVQNPLNTPEGWNAAFCNSSSWEKAKELADKEYFNELSKFCVRDKRFKTAQTFAGFMGLTMNYKWGKTSGYTKKDFNTLALRFLMESNDEEVLEALNTVKTVLTAYETYFPEIHKMRTNDECIGDFRGFYLALLHTYQTNPELFKDMCSYENANIINNKISNIFARVRKGKCPKVLELKGGTTNLCKIQSMAAFFEAQFSIESTSETFSSKVLDEGTVLA